MSTQLETIDFHGSQLYVATTPDGQRWVAVRPICEAIGVDWTGQHHRLRANPQFSCGDISTTGTDGKWYAMVCLPISQINGWLYTINANKVRPDVRENLLLYQRECQEVLFKHFMPHGGTDQELGAIINRLDRMETRIETGFAEYRQVTTSLRDEVDELRTMVEIAFTESEEETIRRLIHRYKTEKQMDGRSVVGWVRSFCDTQRVYGSRNGRVIINALRAGLGEGIIGVLDGGKGEE
jgi:P22_AR N-terminal domain